MAENKSLLHLRIGQAFNNPEYCDLEFVVGWKNQKTTFFAHKFIFANASETFKNTFYPKDKKQKKDIDKIPVKKFAPETVESMLRFLYLDELLLETIHEKLSVYNLAVQFDLLDLRQACYLQLKSEPFNVITTVVHYEYALRENDKHILDRCRKTVSSETMDVLTSKYFFETSQDVLIDILNQNVLNVPDESVLVQVVYRWCENACLLRGKAAEPFNIRELISPLLPYIRFLSLSRHEFEDFRIRYNIVTANESAAIMKKIMDPRCNFNLRGFCNVSRKRTIPQPDLRSVDANKYRSSVNLSRSHVSTGSNGSNSNYFSNRSSSGDESFIHSNYTDNRKLSDSGLYDFPSNSEHAESRMNQRDFQSSSAEKSNTILKFPNYDNSRSLVQSSNSGQPRRINVREINKHQPASYSPPTGSSSGADKTDFFYHDTKTRTNRQSPPIHTIPSSQSTPETKSQANGFHPLLPSQQRVYSSCSTRTFDFSLLEVEKKIHNTIQRDIICSAEIKMEYGCSLAIHGIKLKISNLPSKPSEQITVLVELGTGAVSAKPISRSLLLQNNMLDFQFGKPVYIDQSTPALIKVTVEDMRVDRCNVCNIMDYEMNAGMNVRAKIKLNSYRYNDANIFLISQINYTVS